MKRRILSTILAAALALQCSIGVFAEELIAEELIAEELIAEELIAEESITEEEGVFAEISGEETAETLVTADTGDGEDCVEAPESVFGEIEEEVARADFECPLYGTTAPDESEISGSDSEETDAETLETDESGEIEFVIENVMEVDAPELSDAGTSSVNNICGEHVSYTISGTVLTISGTGAMYDYQKEIDGNRVPYIDSNYDITEIIVEEGVTRIGNYAFVYAGIGDLEKDISVSLPSTLEEIGEGAFYNTTLSEVTLPDGLKTIGEQAFYNTRLTTITIPDSVTGIGKSALGDCNSLKTAVLSEALTEIPGGLFDYCTRLERIDIPERVTKVGNAAFRGCITLRSISFPEHITEIGYNLFNACSNLTYVNLPDAITAIPQGTFQGCTNLSSIIIPEGVTSIGSSAFAFCTSLTELTIPASVMTMGSDTFNGSENLTSVYFLGDVPENLNAGTQFLYVTSEVTLYYFPDARGWSDLDTSNMGDNTITVTPYHAASFGTDSALSWSLRGGVLTIRGSGLIPDYDTYSDVPWYKMCENIKSVVIEEGVTAVGEKAFYDCSNLISVKIADSVTSIGAYAFAECIALAQITISNRVASIGDCAFFECTALAQITIPDCVTSLGEYAFYGCSLTSLVLPASIASIGKSAFQGTMLTEVVFLGARPITGQYAFSVNTERINISYPAGDTTWSGVNSMRDLGGVSSENAIYSVSDVNITIGIHAHTWTTVTKAAACTLAGLKTKTCTSCGTVITETIEKLGHTYSSAVTKAATCTAAGVRTYTCIRCSDSYTKTIDKLGHNASSTWTTTKAATCSAAGTKVKKCTRCSAAVETATIKAKAHSWSAWQETAAATVFEPKHEQRTCSVCKTTASRCSGSALKPTIEVNAANIPLKTGQTTTKVKVSGLAKGDYVKSWKSSDTSIVKVSASGKITAQKQKGTARVTVTLASGKTARVTVKVQKTAVRTKAIYLVGDTKYTVNKGKKLDLAAVMQPMVYPITSLQEIKYSSSNKKVATVSSSGVVTAKAAGTARITIKSGSVKEVVTITVPKTKTTSITGVPSALTLKKGKIYTLKVKVKPSSSDYPVTYKTSNKKVAAVTSKGKIQGIKKGKAVITVASGSIKKTFQITVK